MTVIGTASGKEVEWFSTTERLYQRLRQVVRSRLLLGTYQGESLQQAEQVLEALGDLDARCLAAVHFLRSRRHDNPDEYFEYHKVGADYAKVLLV